MSKEENVMHASEPVTEHLESATSVRHGHIVLIPRPSDDPQDPLRWSQPRKYFLLAILVLASFSGMVSFGAHSLALGAQAKVYHKTLGEVAYTISAAVAGLVVGPVLAVPLAHILGRSSVILWSLVGCMCCGIWSALMTGENDYIPFVVSRLFGGLFSAIPSAVGTHALMDMFFLHERGNVFAIYCFSYISTVVGPTFGGFIVQYVAWPFEFWWTVALQGAVSILVFIFLEETGFTREGGEVYPPRPTGFLKSRTATFFPGTAVAHLGGKKQALRSLLDQFLIGCSPVGILIGFYALGCFGWFVAINTLLTVFLQEPLSAGGYAFTPQNNAAFSVALWIAVLAAQVWGSTVNDRIPLMLSRRKEGIWKPEYRLHSLWLPSMLMPAGLGIFGAALQYHLHYMVLALGSFLVTFAAFCSVPVAINYLTECFQRHPTEVASVLGIYRLALGLAVPFFIETWIEKVNGPGWVFGMMGFFSMLVFLLVIVLMVFGHSLRQVQFGHLSQDEDGAKIVE